MHESSPDRIISFALAVGVLLYPSLSFSTGGISEPCDIVQRYPYSDGKLPLEDRSRPTACIAFYRQWSLSITDACPKHPEVTRISYAARSGEDISKLTVYRPLTDPKALISFQEQLKTRFFGILKANGFVVGLFLSSKKRNSCL